MKRLILTAALVLLATSVWAANTYYVDAGCSSSGTGTSITCGASGPVKTVDEGIALLSSQDDILNIRGTHALHGTCPGTNGIYNTDEYRIQGKSGTSGHPIIIQTLAGDSPQAIIDGTAAVSWTQCTDCSAGSAQTACRNVPGTCGDAWFFTGSGNQLKALFAEKSDGMPTYRVTAIDSNFNNAHSGFITGVCAAPWTWIQCNAASDCPGSVACSGTTTEIDSFSQETNGGTLTVRWGSATKGGVAFDNNGYGFSVCNSNWITIRNLSFRDHRRNAVVPADTGNGGCAVAPTHIVIDNIVSAYTLDIGGSGHSVGLDHIPSASITNSYFAYDSDESIHSDAACAAAQCLGAGNPCSCCTGAGAGATCAGASALTIQGNFFRDNGDSNAVGPSHAAPAGTPSAMIISSSHSAATTGSGDYTGTEISNNYILRNKSHGVLVEDSCSNLKLHDNVISGVGRASIKGACDNSTVGSAVSGNQIYNNVLIGGNAANTGAATIEFEQSNVNCTMNNNLIFNNTCVEPTNGALCISWFAANDANTTGNIVRNNILSTTLGQKMMNWSTSTSATNKFENNLVRTSASPAITWLNVGYTSADIDGGCSTHCTASKTGDPLFANAANSDYHIQTSSPAKDAGTSTGMPSARTRDINNTIASSHGLPSYADNQGIFNSVWDIGADEFSSGTTVDMKITKTDSPDPVVAGNNITYTISYSNASSTSATGVVISDTVPTNTTFVSANNGGALGGGVVTWNIGTVVGGGAGTVQMVVAVASPLANGTIILNNFSIASAEQGTVTGLAADTTVTSLPFLVLGKSDAPDPVLAGSNITYTISYSNTGTAGATGVVIRDTVPVNTTFVSATGGGTQSGGVVTWNIGPVNAGASSSVQMVVQVGAGVANGATITNSTYSMASNELSTLTGAAVSTSVATAAPITPVLTLPITQRQNAWSATQTDTFGPNAHITQGPNGSQWIEGYATEEITLNTGGTTTDSVANLLPTGAVIAAVTARVTTTITVATDWKVGDASQAARFCSANATLAAGTTSVCLNQADPTVATANLGPVQTSAAKVRITTTGTPAAGKIRVTVFYRQFIPPGS